MTTSNDAKLVEMERMMRTAPEPGGLAGVSMGEDVGVTGTSVTSAGYVTMWNTDTREHSTFNMNAVRSKLREVFPNDYANNVALRGLPCWTATAPSEPPWRGTSTCPLHESRPERVAYDTVGYPQCSRIELPNEMDAQEHLRLKHPRTWKLMQVQKDEVERIAQEEDRTLNRQILAHLAGVAEVTAPPKPIVVSEPPPEYMPVNFVNFSDFADAPSEVPSHIHLYAKPMGSVCKRAGCTEVRKTLFKARKK